MVNLQLQMDEALGKAKAAVVAAAEAERSANPFGMWRSYLAAGNAYAEAANLADAELASKLWKDAARMYEKAQATLPPPLPGHPRA